MGTYETIMTGKEFRVTVVGRGKTVIDALYSAGIKISEAIEDLKVKK